MIELLVLCRYFFPENKIGAVRTTKFVKYLSRTGKYKITVVTVMPHGVDCPDYEVTEQGVEIYRISTGKIASFFHFKKKDAGAAHTSAVAVQGARRGLKGILIGYAFRFRIFLENCAIHSGAKRLIREKDSEFDVVFSTYNTEFGHNIARWYKKRHKNTKWIADFRDSVWIYSSTQKEIKKAKCFAKETAKSCDFITAVTDGILQTHAEDFGSRESQVVYNGYDAEDTKLGAPVEDGVLRMVYAGDLYAGKRDLSPLFKALHYLGEQKRIDVSKVEVIYAGNSGGVFLHQLKDYKEIPYVNKGFIPREEALKLQQESQILILASWCHKGDKQTLSGKFFEYLGSSRPILCVLSGEESGSLLSSMINSNQLGFCYENAAHETDFPALCDFIEKQYISVINTKNTDFNPNKDFIERFEYKNLSNEVDKIIATLLKK